MSCRRVLLWGLGAIGTGIGEELHRRGYELAGAISHQVGEDLGDVLGVRRLEARVVAGPGELAEDALRADVCVIATASRVADVEQQILWALENGMHVVTCAEEMSYPAASRPDAAELLDEAARRAGRVVLGTGINPGFAMDLLPIVATAPCLEIHSLAVRRVNDLSPFGPSVWAMFGIGLSQAQFEEGVRNGTIVGHTGFRESLALIQRVTRLAVDEVVEEFVPIIARVERRGPRGPVAVGQVAGVAHSLEARWRGRVQIRLDHPQQVDPGAEGIGTGDFIEIRGRPEISLRIEPEIPGGVGTVAMVVNAIPSLDTLDAGLVTADGMGLPARRIPEFAEGYA